MKLPSPEQITNTEWKQSYKISTSTFDLSSVEKPDMSQYLIHLTSKGNLISILSGEGSNIQDMSEKGFIKSSIPMNKSDGYDAEVVCFTESPVFALDFFRYKSYKRWLDDQRFGIGFSKSILVYRGVRPVFYADNETKNWLMIYKNKISDPEFKVSENPETDEQIKFLIK